ncbi:polyprenol monophosphomannose synthase [Actinospica acidithermotolerans]|uniref:polyprenol monophosphomannose synthase n=1 Tax=Actinospica acidithermotolerans TaxID=2828514 RepID=UPI0027DD5399|nr:polyprenol monophosphomannose synthase [Actinospica acidithermotolerans]
MTESNIPAESAPEADALSPVLIIIPTYNEVDNLERIITRVHEHNPQVHVLVADDNSPDGTGELADKLAAADKRIQVMHRAGKQGLGAAYIAGFKWGLEHGYQLLIEMDADGSHRPEDLPRMLKALEEQNADLVIGSRYVKGGKIVNWPLTRQFLSRGGNTYIHIVMGLKVRDVTAGYRIFRRGTLERLGLDTVESGGYIFQTDLTRRVSNLGMKIVEVPITFVEREIGVSKMNKNIMYESLWRATSWGVEDRIASLTGKRKKQRQS